MDLKNLSNSRILSQLSISADRPKARHDRREGAPRAGAASEPETRDAQTRLFAFSSSPAFVSRLPAFFGSVLLEAGR